MSEEMGMVGPRCDLCKHWKPADEWEANEAGFRECAAVREGWRIQDEASRALAQAYDESDEDQDKYMNVRREALQKERAYVMDGSEYKAILFTAPDFYCALFAALHDTEPTE